MKDENNAIIYVGKANNLYSRVRSYFQQGALTVKTRRLVYHIRQFEYVVTDNEIEAFILENNLIKLHSPKYNIRLKDSKAYPYIKITFDERLPRILFSHKRDKDKAKYYGPFVTGGRIREILDLVHKIWPIRRCSKVFPRDFDKNRPCLNHHIGQCRAPCNRLLDEETYKQFVLEAERFIRGKNYQIRDKLSQEMAKASEEMLFERAAELRDIITALNQLSETQKTETGGDDRDVIAIARDKNEVLVQIFFVRGGKLSGNEYFMMTTGDEETHEQEEQETNTKHPTDSTNAKMLSAFIKQFYSEAAFIPKELTIISAPEEKESIEEWLCQVSGARVRINIPLKGEKREMVQLAQTNAELKLASFGSHLKKEAERNNMALADIAQACGCNIPLARIEAYDISNIQGY